MRSTVRVIATTFEGTCAALATAVPLARGDDARLVLVVPRIASCAAELEMPAESTALMTRRYQNLLRDMGAHADIEAFASVGLDELVATICAAKSCVVVGGPAGHWMTSPEQRFVNRLSRLGCRGVFVPSGVNSTQRRMAA